jgi:hypothetical protein
MFRLGNEHTRTTVYEGSEQLANGGYVYSLRIPEAVGHGGQSRSWASEALVRNVDST